MDLFTKMPHAPSSCAAMDTWLEHVRRTVFLFVCCCFFLLLGAVDVFMVVVILVNGLCMLQFAAGVFCHVDFDWIS